MDRRAAKAVLSGAAERWRLQRAAVVERSATRDAIAADPSFRRGLDELAGRLGSDPDDIIAEALGYLDEIVAVHSDALPDFSLVLSRIADRRAFAGVLRYDREAVDRLRGRNEQQSLALLSGHRSYLDFVLRVPLAERGIAREFRFVGANLDIWPVGTILRSAGMVFVRRGYRNPVYWFVQRHYMAWLTEQRANFWWAIEGGRSRTGKLLRPKAGLLSYLAEAYASGHGRDVALVPATVVWEYLDEVEEFAAYGRGAAKSAESLMLGVRLARRARSAPEQAQIHLGFGEPVALSDHVEPGLDDEELAAAIERTAVEVCRRIDAVTPITSVALVLFPLLERDGVLLSLDELVDRLAPVVERIAAEDLPTFERSLGAGPDLERALGLLSTQGIVATDEGADVTRYSVAPGRPLEAAYYRNAIVHFFVVASMVEIAVARTLATEEGARVVELWKAIDELRSVLDLEFFFPEGDAFVGAVLAVLRHRAPDWETTLELADGVEEVGEQLRPYVAPFTLAPFLEAHGLVANELARLGDVALVDAGYFARGCLARAELELELGRLHRSDVASLNMFETPMVTARARGLTGAGRGARRQEHAEVIRSNLAALATVESWARS